MAKRRISKAKGASTCRNLVIVSDLHAGCQVGLCPATGVRLDEGGRYMPNAIQRQVYGYWCEFWDKWVPQVTKGEPFVLAINGDAIDGVHHQATTQITHSLSDQGDIAYKLLAPVVERAAAYFHIRGTEAHAGKSGVEEERLAERLGARPNEAGQFARYDLWIRVGKALCHLLHHIGTTSSSAHEASAVNAELSAEYVEAARWGEEIPDYVIRSHRHRGIAVDLDSYKGYAAGIVTPGWQGKTPFAYRIAGARISTPQFGGFIIRQGDEEHFYRRIIWKIPRSKVEEVST